MGVPSSSPPPVGSVGVGELLADAQSRTLWLGVPASISAQQALLVSDLIGLQADLSSTLASAASYTDAQVATRSPLGHKHVIADVTGLQAALDAGAASLPSGCIVLWSGTLGTIPGGWALCDGNNGTPDLRDRFVLGAGGSTGNAKTTGGSKNRSILSDLGGAHTHTGVADNTILDITMLPSHGHSVTDPGHGHALTDPGHLHNSAAAIRLPSGGNDFNTYFAGGTNNVPTKTATTGITIADRVTGITIASTGGDQPHNHTLTLANAPSHQHTVTFDVMPPYIILGYIMRV